MVYGSNIYHNYYRNILHIHRTYRSPDMTCDLELKWPIAHKLRSYISVYL